MVEVNLERLTRLELVISAWEARVLPLHYSRTFDYLVQYTHAWLVCQIYGESGWISKHTCFPSTCHASLAKLHKVMLPKGQL